MKLNSRNHPLFVWLTMTAAVMCLIWSSGAASKAGKKERDKAVSKLDQIYWNYVTGTVVEARSNLLKGVEFINANSFRIPELQSSLPMAFERLSLLERKAGNEAQSRIYFEKSRYWTIIYREKLGFKPEEIISHFDTFTREDSDKEVIEWDKQATKGGGANYFINLEQ